MIVSRRAAEKIAEAEGIELFDAIRKAPALKMHGHVRSNMIYGAWRKRRGYLYWTCPVYWVEDGKVFTSTYHTYENPHTGANNE